MARIERVITTCTECVFSKEFQDMGSNCDYVLICTQNDSYYEENFMITRSSNRIRGYIDIEIPAGCPLEKYTK